MAATEIPRDAVYQVILTNNIKKGRLVKRPFFNDEKSYGLNKLALF